MTHPGGIEKRAEVVRRQESKTRPVLRFAPSPNGALHLGHAYSALFSARAAKAMGGCFLLRIEDIDTTRARPEYTNSILDDLAWLGLEWEEPVRVQSTHMDDYRAALSSLEAKGLLYPSRASRKDIAAAVAEAEDQDKSWPRDPDGAPHYPRKAMAGVDSGSGPRSLRLDMGRAMAALPRLGFAEIGTDAPPEGETLTATPQMWGDALLARKDIGTSYHLSVVVDDALQGITHVTRGADLAPATHLHRLLQHHLDLPVPVYCHHQLLCDAAGRKLAKSAGSKSLGDLRAEGMTRQDIHRLCGIDHLMGYFEQSGSSTHPQ